MSLTTLTIFGGILAVLVVLAGMLVARAGPVGTAGQRLFFFLITAGVLLFLTVVLTPLLPARDNRPGSPTVYLLAGASLGIITLILLNLKLLKGMKVTERRLAVVLLAVLGLLFFLTGRENSGILIWLIPLALLLLVGWSIRSWKLLPAAAGLVLLALLGLEPLTGLLTRLGEPLNLPAGYFIFTLTGLGPVLAAAAISGGLARLNVRDASQGSTLYLVSPGSGKVQAALPVKDASDQSAPWIEFLSEDELLLHGQGQLKLLDFSTSPPRIRDAMQELFSLDLHYPNEISAAGAFRLEGKAGYHLVLRANHPRNQAVYLYHSQNNQVEILHPDAHALLLMPDGEAVEMPRLEPFPEEGDIYELYRTGAAGREPTRLTVEGHLPRAYPGLSLHYLPRSSRLAFASQQGVSLVALPQGELLSFWELAGGSGINPSVFADPDEQALIVLADGVGLYWIPLGN